MTTEPTNPKDATGAEKEPGKGEVERTLTQSEVNAIIKERLEREREKYAGFEELKKKAEQWAAYEETQKSELQKAQEAAQKAHAEKEDALKIANERMVRAEFIAEASRANVAHPEDAFALAERKEVTITDDGKVIGVAEAVKVLVEAGRLPLTTRPPAPKMDAGAGSGERSTEHKPDLTEEERLAARKMGIKYEDYAKNKLAKE